MYQGLEQKIPALVKLTFKQGDRQTMNIINTYKYIKSTVGKEYKMKGKIKAGANLPKTKTN